MSNKLQGKTDIIVSTRKVSEIRDFPVESVGSWFRGSIAQVSRKTRLKLFELSYGPSVAGILSNISSEWEVDLLDPHMSLKEFLEYREASEVDKALFSEDLAREIYIWGQNLKSSQEHVDVRKHWLQYGVDVSKDSKDILAQELIQDGPTKVWALQLFQRMVKMADFLLDEEQRSLTKLFFDREQLLNAPIVLGGVNGENVTDSERSRLFEEAVDEKYRKARVIEGDIMQQLSHSSFDEFRNLFDQDDGVMFRAFSRMHALLAAHHLTDSSSHSQKYYQNSAKPASLEVLWDLMESMHLPTDVLQYVVSNTPDLEVEWKDVKEYNAHEVIRFVSTQLVYLGEFKIPDAENVRRIHQNGEPPISGYISIKPSDGRRGIRMALPDGLIEQYIASLRKLRLQRAEDEKFSEGFDKTAYYFGLVEKTEQRIVTLEQMLNTGSENESQRKMIKERLRRAKGMQKVLDGINVEKFGSGIVAEYTPDALSSRLLAFYLADTLLRKHPELFHKYGITTFDDLLKNTDQVAVIAETRRAGYYKTDHIDVRKNFGDLPPEVLSTLAQSDKTILPEILLVVAPFISFGHCDFAEVIRNTDTPTPRKPRNPSPDKDPRKPKKRKRPSERKSVEVMDDEDILLRRAVFPLSLSRQIQMHTKVRDAFLKDRTSPELPVRKVCSLRAVTDREIPNFIQDYRNVFISSGFIKSYDEMPSWVSYLPGQIPQQEQFDLVEMVISQETNGVLNERLNNALAAVEPGGTLELTSLTYPLTDDVIESLKKQGCDISIEKLPGTSYAEMFDLSHFVRTKGYPQEFQNMMMPYMREATKSIHVIRIGVGSQSPHVDDSVRVVDESTPVMISEEERSLASILPIVLKQLERLPQRLAKEFIGSLLILQSAVDYSLHRSDPTRARNSRDEAHWNDPLTQNNVEKSLKILGREGVGNPEVVGLLDTFLMTLSRHHDFPAYSLMLLGLQMRLKVQPSFEFLPKFVMNLDENQRRAVFDWLESSPFASLVPRVVQYLEQYQGDREIAALEVLELLSDRDALSLDEEPEASVIPEKEESSFQMWKNEMEYLSSFSDEQKVRWMKEAFRLGNQAECQKILFELLSELSFESPELVLTGVMNPYSQKIEREYLPQISQFAKQHSLIRYCRDALLLRFFTHPEVSKSTRLNELSAPQKRLWFDFSVGKTLSFHEADEQRDDFVSPDESTQAEALLAVMMHDELKPSLIIDLLNDPEFTFYTQRNVQEAFEALGVEPGALMPLNEVAFDKIENAIEFGMDFAQQCREKLKKDLSARMLTLMYQALGADHFQKRLESLTMCYFGKFDDELVFRAQSKYRNLEKLFDGASTTDRMLRITSSIGEGSADIADSLPLYGACLMMANNIPQDLSVLFELTLEDEQYARFLPEFLEVVFGPEDANMVIPDSESEMEDLSEGELPLQQTEKMITLNELSDLLNQDHDKNGRIYVEVYSDDGETLLGRGLPSKVKKIPEHMEKFASVAERISDDWRSFAVMAVAEHNVTDWTEYDINKVTVSLLHEETEHMETMTSFRADQLLRLLQKVTTDTTFGLKVNKRFLPMTFDAERGVFTMALDDVGNTSQGQDQEWAARINQLGAFSFESLNRLEGYDQLSELFPFEVTYQESTFSDLESFLVFKAQEKKAIVQELKLRSPLIPLKKRVKSAGLQMRVNRKSSKLWSNLVYRKGDMIRIEADRSHSLFQSLTDAKLLETIKVEEVDAFLKRFQGDLDQFHDHSQIEIFGEMYDVRLTQSGKKLRWAVTLPVEVLYEARVKKLTPQTKTQIPVYYLGITEEGRKTVLPQKFEGLRDGDWLTNMYQPPEVKEESGPGDTEVQQEDAEQAPGLFGRVRRFFGGE